MNEKSRLKIFSKIESILMSTYLLGIYFFPDKIKIVSIAFVLCFCFIQLILQRKIIVSASSMIWICYIILSLLSCVWGKGRGNDILEFIISISIALLLSIFNFSDEERKSQINGLVVVGLVVVFGCILQLIFPDTLKQINAAHLTPEKYNYFYDFYKAGKLVGFSFQTAITGFYLTLLFSIIFSKFLCSVRKNNVVKNAVYMISLIIIYIFIFLTAKRSFILLIPGGIFIIMCFLLRKHIRKIIIYFSIMIIVMMILLYKTEAGQELLLRSLGNNWSTGREQINDQMIQIFWNSPLFGNGVCSTLVLLSGYQNAHNIYLQVLSESGILGLFIIVIALIIGLSENIKALSLAIKNKQNDLMVRATICLFIQIIFLGWGFTGNPLYDVYPFFIYMFSIGCINSVRKKQGSENIKSYESWNYYILSQKQ